MTRMSRLILVAVVATAPIAACSSSPTGPETPGVRKDGGSDSVQVDTTKRHDTLPWG